MRSISSTLLAAQESTSATPYVRVRINGNNYSSNTGKLLGLEHHEMPYMSAATIILTNDDRSMDDVDLRGEFFEIAYGFVTGVGNEYPDDPNAATSGLYVKSQHIVSYEGKCVCLLQCEGLWDVLREKRAIILADPPTSGVVYDKTKTVYELVKLLLSSCDYDLAPLGSQDDSIIDDFKPYFQINYFPYESVGRLVDVLMQMTKCYLRAIEGREFEVVYPQEADDVDETYYSNHAHFFFNYTEKTNILIPNKVTVYGNRDKNGSWKHAVSGSAEDSDQIAMYDAGEILWDYAAPVLETATDCENRAAAILTKFQSEMLSGRLVIPHDCRVELYDRVSIHDGRGK